MARRRGFPYWLTVLVLLLVGTGSWVIYSVINQGSADLLAIIGIENFYIKSGIIFLTIILFLYLLGYSIKKTLNKIIR